jgi:hypothetical protein
MWGRERLARNEQLAQLAGLASWPAEKLLQLAKKWTWVAELAAGGLASELAAFGGGWRGWRGWRQLAMSP